MYNSVGICIHGLICMFAQIAILPQKEFNYICINLQTGKTAFLWACQYGRLEAVQYLLTQSVDIHVKDKVSEMELSFKKSSQLLSNYNRILYYLYNCQVGDNAMILAGSRGNSEIVKLLEDVMVSSCISYNISDGDVIPLGDNLQNTFINSLIICDLQIDGTAYSLTCDEGHRDATVYLNAQSNVSVVCMMILR